MEWKKKRERWRGRRREDQEEERRRGRQKGSRRQEGGGKDIYGEQGISLAAQWLGIGLPMYWTWVGPLVWKDHSCHQAIKPVCLNY